MDDQVLELARNFDPSHPAMATHADRPFEVFDVLRETSPVLHVEHQPRVNLADGPGWVLTRYEDVARVFRDDEHFSSVGIFGPSETYEIPTDEVALEDVDPRTMARMTQRFPMLLDPPEFNAYRRLMTPLLAPSRVAARERDTRALVNRLIDDFVETGSCDFQQQISKPLPGILTCQLLGLPVDRWRFFADPIDEFVHREGAAAMRVTAGTNYEDSPLARLQVPGVMGMLEIAAERRDEPRDDIISGLVNLEIDGRRLNNYELGGMLSILLSGGTETTTSAMSSAVVYLGRHPELRRRLAAEPALIPVFAEEVLRMWPPIMTFFRIAKQACSIDGHAVSPGDAMYLVLAAANRDPEVFPDPNTFVFDRDPNRHLTFTVGVHRCLGSHLARLELRISLEEVLRRLPEYTLREEDVVLSPSFPSAFGYVKVGADFVPGAREAV